MAFSLSLAFSDEIMPLLNFPGSVDYLKCPSCSSHFCWFSWYPHSSLFRTLSQDSPSEKSSYDELPNPALEICWIPPHHPILPSLFFHPLSLAPALLTSLLCQLQGPHFRWVSLVPIQISTCCWTKLPEEAFFLFSSFSNFGNCPFVACCHVHGLASHLSSTVLMSVWTYYLISDQLILKA